MRSCKVLHHSFTDSYVNSEKKTFGKEWVVFFLSWDFALLFSFSLSFFSLLNWFLKSPLPHIKLHMPLSPTAMKHRQPACINNFWKCDRLEERAGGIRRVIAFNLKFFKNYTRCPEGILLPFQLLSLCLWQHPTPPQETISLFSLRNY